MNETRTAMAEETNSNIANKKAEQLLQQELSKLNIDGAWGYEPKTSTSSNDSASKLNTTEACGEESGGFDVMQDLIEEKLSDDEDKDEPHIG